MINFKAEPEYIPATPEYEAELVASGMQIRGEDGSPINFFRGMPNPAYRPFTFNDRYELPCFEDAELAELFEAAA